MTAGILPIAIFLEMIACATVLFMHISKKNSSAVVLYLVQSAAVMLIFLRSASLETSGFMLLTAAVAVLVKVVIAPYFFLRLIRKHRMTFSASTYLSVPITLLGLAALCVVIYSSLFRPLLSLSSGAENALFLALTMMSFSIFLVLNRKGILSQILGILSLENGIVLFASFAGLEQSPALHLGVLFDVFVWIAIATLLASMIYTKFGSLDIAGLNSLKEE